ncbi:MAG: hypothetical protein GY811_29380 [Myxococcales bacterium]|nr:hypothetical protein [Myxococcales bacterium]
MVLAPGSYVENVSISDTTLNIIGNGTRIFPPGFVPGSPFSVLLGADVSLEDAILEGGNSVGIGVGLGCSSSSLRLIDVTVRGNDYAGITVENCTLRLTDPTIRGNAQEGIQLRTGSVLTLRGSGILDSGFHGQHVTSSAVDIR